MPGTLTHAELTLVIKQEPYLYCYAANKKFRISIKLRCLFGE